MRIFLLVDGIVHLCVAVPCIVIGVIAMSSSPDEAVGPLVVGTVFAVIAAKRIFFDFARALQLPRIPTEDFVAVMALVREAMSATPSDTVVMFQAADLRQRRNWVGKLFDDFGLFVALDGSDFICGTKSNSRVEKRKLAGAQFWLGGVHMSGTIAPEELAKFHRWREGLTHCGEACGARLAKLRGQSQSK